MMVIHPLHVRWQAHQDTLHTPVGLQPEKRPFVMYQVELYIASAADFLPCPVFFGIWEVLSSFHDRHISAVEAVAYFGHKIIPLLHTQAIGSFAMVKEQPAYTPGFITVCIPKV